MSTSHLGLADRLPRLDVRQSPHLARRQLKRAMDLTLAAAALLCAGPLVLLLGLLVKLTSRGPVLYAQERLGKLGKPFRLLKLRTMCHDAEPDGPAWATAGDPRVTPLGRFLRRTHLDELPQLVNVLRGDMSLIGPRPERPCFVDALRRRIPLYTVRLAVRPGITGLAQIRHHADRSVEDVQAKLAYDLEYIRRAGLWLDLRILARTLAKMLSARGGPPPPATWGETGAPSS